jgi:ribonucleoside-diphosphate reductase alpha chain
MVKEDNESLEVKFKPKYKEISLSDNPKKYSPLYLGSYDKNRHVLVDDSYGLINNEGLDKERLNSAMTNDEIFVYEFNGKKYLDRFDIGRIFHNNQKKEGLTIEKYFSKDYDNPFDSVNYTKRHIKIEDFVTKKAKFEMADAEIPEWMNDTDASIVADKYFFKPTKKEWKEKLKESIGSEYESSLKHLNKRVADFFADEGWRFGYFKTEEDRENFRNELSFLQINGAGAFNSPTQFNAGLFNSYGIKGSSGINYIKDSETGNVKKVLDGEYIHPQLHACFIRGPRDDLESLSQQSIDEIGIFSSGSGVGHNASSIRSNGESLSGGGKASGLISFEVIYDKIAGSIKSGGKTRRAARMLINDYTHPEIMDFIRFKVNEDKKALTLMQNGFSPGMDGDAYTTVALQNTNLTVRLDDKFFEAMDKGEDIQTYNVNDGKPNKRFSAERMLKEIAFGSWRIGDPAVQYNSKIQEMHTAKNSGKQTGTNPCGEYAYLNDSSCSLFSQKLTYFLRNDGTFDIDGFIKSYRIFSIAQNIANEAASYPVKEIAMISPEFATIGAGYADLGSLLMRKGIPYDSKKGRALAGAISALMTGSVYETSAEIAKAKGTFIHYEFNKNSMLDVMKKHKKNLDDIIWEDVGDEKLKEAAYKSWENALEQGEKNGFSNAQATVLAPTGTISFLMGCSTTGIEPALSLRIRKNLAGGGHVIIANKDVEIALKNLGYSKEQIEDISKYVGKHNTMVNAPHVYPEHYRVFDTSFGNAKGEGSIGIDGHLGMMAAAQPFISGAISKTNNLPESATVKDIYDCYIKGHELGLKGITVFRNNSKPISAVDFGGHSHKKLKRGEKEELPSRRESFEWEVQIGGTPFHIITSEYEDGRPGQITFLSYKAGSTLGAILTTTGISASKALKRGLSLEDAIEGWGGQQFEPNGLVVGHPYIKTANSPLDLAYKVLRLEYFGDKEMAEPLLRNEVNLNDLRGAKNGAFRTYQRMNINEWNIDDVLKDSETGGFVEGSGFVLPDNNHNGDENGKKNSRGKTCGGCGNIMHQTGPNCFECKSCGDKVGGCGA